MATHAGMTTEEFEKIVQGLDRHREASEDQTALHRDGLSADARTARLSARERLQDLHRLRRRHRVHAPVGGEGLWHSARAGRRQQQQDEVRDARRQARAREAAGGRTSSTTRRASPSASSSYIGRRPIAAFGNSDGDLQMLQWTTAGERRALLRSSSTTPTPSASGPTTAHRHIGSSTRRSDEAKAKGWTVVSMKDDWKTIFPFTNK